MLCCALELAHRFTKRHLEACFFIVSWNFPVTQLWEQLGGRSEGVGSIDEPDSSAWLSVWGSVCVGLVFRRCLRQNVQNSTL